jgi:hypothetical protein
MANQFFACALIVGFFAVLSGSGCERSPISPSTFTSPPSTPTPTPTSTPPQPVEFTVTALSPAVGLNGDVVRVTGTGFVAGATVTLDGEPARVTNTSGGFIVAITPAHPVGEVDVTVTNPDGQSSTLPRGFAYEIVTLKASTDTIAAGAGRPWTLRIPIHARRRFHRGGAEQPGDCQAVCVSVDPRGSCA